MYVNSTYAVKYLYDVAIFSYNYVDKILLNAFGVEILIDLIIEQSRDFNVSWPINSNCHVELHDFFNYENLDATVVDAKYTDEYGI